VAANAFVGVRLVDRRDRALLAIREEFAPIRGVSECMVITSLTASLPLRLEYVLRSQWPDARFSVVPDWDAALQRVRSNQSTAAQPLILVDWNPQGTRPSDFRIPGLEVRQLKAGPVFEDRLVQCYVATPTPLRAETPPSRPRHSAARHAGRFPGVAGLLSHSRSTGFPIRWNGRVDHRSARSAGADA
jgi:hypothetical protein